MYVINERKQNRNQKVLYHYCENSHCVTNHTSFIILAWWAHYIFKDNTFIQYLDSRLAFTPAS